MNRGPDQPLYRVVGFEVVPHRSVLAFSRNLTSVNGFCDLPVGNLINVVCCVELFLFLALLSVGKKSSIFAGCVTEHTDR